MKVLHVVESLLGGVATAVEDYILNTPEIEHFLLGYRRPGSHKSDALDQLVGEVIPMAAGHRRRIQQVLSMADAIQPSLIHAHSSWAGVYARVSPVAGRFPVVYTPHCYALERTDIGRTRRFAFRGIENLLHPRTACVAAVGPREADLARSFRPRRPVVHVPNIIPSRRWEGTCDGGVPLHVVTVGRLCPQKDPDFLAAAAESPAGRHMRWTWIGSGDDRYMQRLSQVGVDVTGWMSRSETLRRLEQADVYVHTAAWEGAPMTLLEAAAFGLPILARRIPALSALGVEALFDTPDQLADGIAELASPARAAELRAASHALAARHTPERQREALLHAYRLALAEPAHQEGESEGQPAEMLSAGASTVSS